MKALLKRDLMLALRAGGGFGLGLAFFLIVTVLVPFSVGPDPVLLTSIAGTVDENLRLGRSEIGSQAMNEIVEKMGLQRTVTRFEKGFNTVLSVTGYPLSTGQAIRLVLARALIARPAALLIDGLLDRLPDEDLSDVLNRLNEFKPATTIVIATGRQAVADWADLQVDISGSTH